MRVAARLKTYILQKKVSVPADVLLIGVLGLDIPAADM